jgi:HK97 family phage portal protein
MEVWPYHAGQVRPVPGGELWIVGYEFDEGNGSWRQLPADDVLHFKWPSVDPTQPWQAQPPLRAPAAEVDADNEMTRYLAALLANDAMPRTVLTTPSGAYPDDDAVRRMKQQWRERYGGSNRGDVAVLEEGVTVSRLGLNLQELAFEALHAVPESRIAAALRVPPIIAGLTVGLNRSTFANYGEARRSFTQDTLVPFWRLMAGEVQSGLLAAFRDRSAVSVAFDLSQVSSLAEGAVAIRTRALDGYTRGALTRNETRAEIGYGPAADGDLFVEEVDALAMAGPLTLPAQPEQRAAELGARLELKARSTARTEAAMRRALQRYLAEQYEQAARAAEGN